MPAGRSRAGDRRGIAGERHRRGGTENILSIRSLLEIIPYLQKVGEIYPQLQELRNYFESSVRNQITNVYVNAESALRLPNTSSLVIDGIDGETLLMRLDLAGFAVSTGAACSSGSPEPSPVLMAMGLSRVEAQSSLRVSLGWENTKEDIDVFVKALKEIVAHLRSLKKVDPRKEKQNLLCSLTTTHSYGGNI